MATFATTLKRLVLVLSGAFLMALNLNTFVHAGGLIPGGFTGITLLAQEVLSRYAGLAIPFSVILYALNAVPAVICFRAIGKNFVLYSCLMVAVSGLLTDFMPAMFLEYITVHDTLLAAVFGGILNAVAIALCLHADATSGGTDFIAIFIAEKYGKDAWNYIFAGNCAILILAGWLFALDKALYSIIFQFTTTMALGALYKGYQRRTLLIVTEKHDEVYALIRDQTNHDATSFTGIGRYQMKERVMLYSVVAANETPALIVLIRKIDPNAFINVIKTESVNGRFFRRPKS